MTLSGWAESFPPPPLLPKGLPKRFVNGFQQPEKNIAIMKKNGMIRFTGQMLFIFPSIFKVIALTERLGIL
jgi:hypothetical protein